MAEKNAKTKRRKLRTAPVTVRERAERETAKQQGNKRRLRAVLAPVGHGLKIVAKPFRFVGRLPIWKPLRIVGRIILPPYIRNSWRELRLVEWPNGKQTRQLTFAVIVFSVVACAIVAGFDYGLDKLFREVLTK